MKIPKLLEMYIVLYNPQPNKKFKRKLENTLSWKWKYLHSNLWNAAEIVLEEDLLHWLSLLENLKGLKLITFSYTLLKLWKVEQVKF